jgi:hypothetical protein
MLFTAVAALMKKTNFASLVFAAALTLVVYGQLGVISLIRCLTVARNLYFLNRCNFIPA